MCRLPASRFVVPKEKERAEVIVENPPTGFDFRKGETYTFKYSFRAKEGMRVSGSSTRFGQLKGSSGGFLLKGDPLMAITATNDGLNVRFANLDSNRRNGMDRFLSWEAATGEWVHVVITTTFGRSMKVRFGVILYVRLPLKRLEYRRSTCMRDVIGYTTDVLRSSLPLLRGDEKCVRV